MWRSFFGFVVSLLLCAAAFAVESRADGATLVVNEVPVYSFESSHAQLTPAKRALAAAESMKRVSASQEVTKQKVGTNWKVMVGDRLILLVTPTDAKAKKTSALAIATTVCSRLADALALPPLLLSVAKLDVPTGRVTKVNLSGWASRKATLSSSVAGVVSVNRDSNILTLTAKKPGQTKVKAIFNGHQAEMVVQVLPYAFLPGAPLTAQVIGSPADASVVAGAASAAIQTRSLTPEQNKVWVRVIDPKPLAPGKAATVRAKVKATGTGHFPYEGEVSVTVTNVGGDLPREDLLWYSNEPEQVEKPGRLYWAELDSGKTARLLYHHQSAYSMPQVIRYMVANPTAKDANVSIALGDSRPDKNPTRAGYVAGDQFLVKWLSRSGEVVRVPANSVVPITLRRLGPGETCSGVATINLQSGGAERLVVIGDSVMAQTLYDGWEAGQGVAGAWHAVRPKSLESVRFSLDGQGAGVFPEPFKEVRLDYEVGGRFGFTRIGDVPIVNSTDNTSLPGNFGVIYDIQGTLKNGTTAPAEVEVLFETSAGFGSGLFILNGELVRVGLIQPKQEITLASIKLPAGAEKPIRIQTMPLSGANYPVTLIVRPTGFESLALRRR